MCKKRERKITNFCKAQKNAASVTRTHDLQIGIRRIEVLLQSDDLPANLWPQILRCGLFLIIYLVPHCKFRLKDTSRAARSTTLI